MKTAKKPKPKPAAAPTISQSPRQIALRKLYRVLTIGGGAAIILGAAVSLAVYGDDLVGLIHPRSNFRRASPTPAQEVEPKVNANNRPKGDAPEDMVWIPGGQFYMGCDLVDFVDEPLFPDAFTIHPVYVDGFWMDRTEVTNEQFAKFVEATNYVTDAEKKVNPKDFPEVPAYDGRRKSCSRSRSFSASRRRKRRSIWAIL